MAVLQRHIKGSSGTFADQADKQAHFLGGTVTLVEVTEDGITQRELMRWPDEAGRLIEPDPAELAAILARDAAPNVVQFATEAERRAAEKRWRKAERRLRLAG